MTKVYLPLLQIRNDQARLKLKDRVMLPPLQHNLKGDNFGAIKKIYNKRITYTRKVIIVECDSGKIREIYLDECLPIFTHAVKQLKE